MGTHGPYYSPVNPYYSKGQVQAEPTQIDFYDDAIRDFDAYLGQLMMFLQESGLQDNTIVVIYSDHGKDLTFDRVPLVFFFPHGESAGVITANSQNLDVAPTLLDYLDLPIPTWMEGDSLLASKMAGNRRIFIPGVNFDKFSSRPNWNEIDTTQIMPPFFQFGKLRMVVCDKFFQVDLTSEEWSEGQIPGHTAPCDPSTLPTMTEARQTMIDHLAGQNFDVSILQD
jgi:arylsulfatase A-like enzyme